MHMASAPAYDLGGGLIHTKAGVRAYDAKKGGGARVTLVQAAWFDPIVQHGLILPSILFFFVFLYCSMIGVCCRFDFLSCTPDVEPLRSIQRFRAPYR